METDGYTDHLEHLRELRGAAADSEELQRVFETLASQLTAEADDKQNGAYADACAAVGCDRQAPPGDRFEALERELGAVIAQRTERMRAHLATAELGQLEVAVRRARDAARRAEDALTEAAGAADEADRAALAERWSGLELSASAPGEADAPRYALRRAHHSLLDGVDAGAGAVAGRVGMPAWLGADPDASPSMAVLGLPSPSEIVRIFTSFSDVARREGILALEDYFDPVDEADSAGIPPVIVRMVQAVTDGEPPERIARKGEIRFARLRHRLDELEMMVHAALPALAEACAPYYLDEALSNSGLPLFPAETEDTDGAGAEPGDAAVIASLLADAAASIRAGTLADSQEDEGDLREMPLSAGLQLILRELLSDEACAADAVSLLFTRFREELDIAAALVTRGTLLLQEGARPAAIEEELRGMFPRGVGGEPDAGLLELSGAGVDLSRRPQPLFRSLEELAGRVSDVLRRVAELEGRIREQSVRAALEQVKQAVSRPASLAHPAPGVVAEPAATAARARAALVDFEAADAGAAARAREAMKTARATAEAAYARRHPSIGNLRHLIGNEERERLAAVALRAFVERERHMREAAERATTESRALVEQELSRIAGDLRIEHPSNDDEPFELEVARRLFGEGPAELAGLVDRLFESEADRRLLEPYVFRFSDIRLLDNIAIQKVLRETDMLELAKALKGSTEEVRDVFTRNMSSRAATLLTEDMEYMGPVRRRDAEDARARVIDVVRKLELQGEIVVPASESEELLD